MSSRKSAAISEADAGTSRYRVISESYPSGRGCYSGQNLGNDYMESCTTRRVVGLYENKTDAIQAAELARLNEEIFDEWGEEFYGDKPPPYWSIDCEDSDIIGDNDEDVHIYIEDLAAQNAAKKEALKKAKASAPPPKNKNKKIKTATTSTTSTSSSPSPFTIGTKVSKKFDGTPYSGKVVSYDIKHKLYKIEYEDGDGEEMDDKDINRYLVAAEPKAETTMSNPTATPAASSVKKEKKEPLPSKSTSKSTSSSSLTPNERKFGPVKETKKAITARIDKNRFVRNPCCVSGGEQHLSHDYGNSGRGNPLSSYYYLVQRLSDRNYAMRGLCIDGDGMQYTSFKKADIVYPCVVFLPETDLNDHAKDPTILDACHLDMIDPATGECFLTGTNLLKAVTAETECMFLNGYQEGGASGDDTKEVDPNAIVEAINICKENLQCFCLTECVINNEIFKALAACKKLRGLTLYMTQQCNNGSDSTRADDDGLAAIIKACVDLRWLFIVEKSDILRDASWKAFDSPTACPNLEVLWMSSYKSNEFRDHVTYGDHDVIRRVLTNRASTLKACMINCDENLKSRYIIGGAKKTDRLEGDVKKTYPRDDVYW